MGELVSALDALAADDLFEFSDRQVPDRTTMLTAARNRLEAELARTVRRGEALPAVAGGFADGMATAEQVPVAAAVTGLVLVRRPPPPRMGTRPRRDTFVENSGPPVRTAPHHVPPPPPDRTRPEGRWHTYRPDGTESLVDPYLRI